MSTSLYPLTGDTDRHQSRDCWPRRPDASNALPAGQS